LHRTTLLPGHKKRSHSGQKLTNSSRRFAKVLKKVKSISQGLWSSCAQLNDYFCYCKILARARAPMVPPTSLGTGTAFIATRLQLGSGFLSPWMQRSATISTSMRYSGSRLTTRRNSLLSKLVLMPSALGRVNRRHNLNSSPLFPNTA